MASFMYQSDGTPAEVLFMDDTFGLTKYGYRFFALMVRQDDGSGVPVAWLLTNGDDADRLILFLMMVKENAERANRGALRQAHRPPFLLGSIPRCWVSHRVVFVCTLGAGRARFEPKFVMTDQAQSEAQAIRTVFPGSQHVICQFHFLCNIRDNLHRRMRGPHTGELKNKILSQIMMLAFGGFANEAAFHDVRCAVSLSFSRELWLFHEQCIFFHSACCR